MTITGLAPDTLQGDAAILDILRRCGARFTRTAEGISFEKAPLHGVDIDLADCPDLGPVLMVLGLLCEGTTVIRNAERLRLKESDRIAAMEAELRAVGGLVESEGGTSMEEYADDLYDYCQFGYGENRDGVLLVVSIGDRKWHISTCGYGITAFTDAGIQYLGEQMTPFMADGDYAGAFRTFVQWSDTYIDAARAGHPYDVNNLPREPLSLMYLFLALGIGLVLAWVVVSVMKSQLRSVAFQENAASYVREGSMNLTNSRELFLYRDVQRTEHVEEKDSDSSGGSSTHTSSSGTTHGGGGGSF